MPVKINTPEGTHLLKTLPPSLGALIEKVKTFFPNQPNVSFKLSYIDTDNEKILLSSGEDYDIMKEFADLKNLRIFVDLEQSSNSQNSEVS